MITKNIKIYIKYIKSKGLYSRRTMLIDFDRYITNKIKNYNNDAEELIELPNLLISEEVPLNEFKMLASEFILFNKNAIAKGFLSIIKLHDISINCEDDSIIKSIETCINICYSSTYCSYGMFKNYLFDVLDKQFLKK